MMIDKAAVLAALRVQLEADLAAIAASQRETQAGATHEESRPENDKDTRALESTYLARGLAQRVADLQAAVSALATLRLRRFDDDAATALTALIEVEDDDGDSAYYFIAPAGGGQRVMFDGLEISVVTPQSPLGKALLGRHRDDEVELATAHGRRALTIVDVC